MADQQASIVYVAQLKDMTAAGFSSLNRSMEQTHRNTQRQALATNNLLTGLRGFSTGLIAAGTGATFLAKELGVLNEDQAKTADRILGISGALASMAILFERIGKLPPVALAFAGVASLAGGIALLDVLQSKMSGGGFTFFGVNWEAQIAKFKSDIAGIPGAWDTVKTSGVTAWGDIKKAAGEAWAKIQSGAAISGSALVTLGMIIKNQVAAAFQNVSTAAQSALSTATGFISQLNKAFQGQTEGVGVGARAATGVVTSSTPIGAAAAIATVIINVQGSIMSEGELARTLADKLRELIRGRD